MPTPSEGQERQGMTPLLMESLGRFGGCEQASEASLRADSGGFWPGGLGNSKAVRASCRGDGVARYRLITLSKNIKSGK